MKKLLFIIAATALACSADAATWLWKTAKSDGAVYLPGQSESTLSSGTAYIFLATDAQTVFDTWCKGDDWTAGTLDTSSPVAAGKITAKDEGDAFSYDADPLSAVFAVTTTIEGKDYLYLSTVASEASRGEMGAAVLSFTETAASQLAALDATGGYKGEGHWYAAAPEPTSGMLLLLGFAGLMLKRKRA